MNKQIPFVVLFALLALSAARADILPGLEAYGDLTLVDEVDCATDTTHDLRDYPDGASYVTNILGSDCRAIAHPFGSAGYFAYRLGKGKGLEPHAMYLLVAEYPEDVPRTATLFNKGQGSRNGFYTGKAVGVSLVSILAQVRPESVGVPLSGGYARVEQTMVLNERVYPLAQPPDKGEKADRLVSSAENGFDVAFQVFQASAAPDSAGAAVRSIRLYRMNDEAGVRSAPRYPAGDAPRRLVTWREEMGNDYWRISNADPLDGTRHKARLAGSLGLNCFSRTMLEFGYDKNWDAAYSNEVGAAWWHDGWNADYRWATSANSDYWSGEVDVWGDAGFYLLPYYEYAGGRGPSGLGYSSWRKAVTLFEDATRTGKDGSAKPMNEAAHQNKFVKGSNGASAANVDLTQEAAYSDFERMLACTILRYKDRASFAGAWVRNRGSMPVSFSDAALADFCRDTGREAGSVTRNSILDTIAGDGANNRWVSLSKYGTNRWSSLYSEYRSWWYGRRADWLEAMQDYLEEEGGLAGAKVFFTSPTGEAGPMMHEATGDSADYVSGRAKALGVLGSDATLSGRASYNPPYMAEGYNQIGLFVDTWNFMDSDNANDKTYFWEYIHADPAHDPQTYRSRSDVALSYPYDTVYSALAGGPDFRVPSFRNASGDLFFTRFLNLHEGTSHAADGSEAFGYFTAEMDHAGRAVVLPELWGVLYQDPTVIGFLQGNQLARNFSAAFREFAENFTALPPGPAPSCRATTTGAPTSACAATRATARRSSPS